MLVVLLAALGFRCAGPEGDEALRIAMIPKLVGIGYFEATEQGAREAARELDVELVYDGPTDARTEDQIKMIDGWMAQGFDVIAVAPNDPEAISRTLRSAGESGALVLTWDTDANPELSRRSVFVNQAPIGPSATPWSTSWPKVSGRRALPCRATTSSSAGLPRPPTRTPG